MKNIVNKFIIWITSLTLVLVFTFGELTFIDDSLKLRLNQNAITQTHAVTRGEVAGALMLGIYYVISGQAFNYLAQTTDVVIDQVRTWWDQKMVTNDEGLVAFQDEAVDFIIGTNQDYSEQFVLPNEMITELVQIAQQYYQETTHLKLNYYRVTVDGQEKRIKYPYYIIDENNSIPLIDSSSTYLTLNGDSGAFLFKPNIQFSLTRVGTSNVLRLQGITSEGVILDIYSQSLEAHVEYFNKYTWVPYWKNVSNQVVPFIRFIVDDQTKFTSTVFPENIKFNCFANNGTNCTFGANYGIGGFGYNPWDYMKVPGLGVEEFYYTDVPASWTENGYDNTADYYSIPVIQGDVNISNAINSLNPGAAMPTPIPQENNDDYVYIPPTGGGSIPMPDITDGMPGTAPIESVNDPSSSVPLPGVDDLLDGTYFKDIAVWFTSWLTLTISNATSFWNVAWANLTSGVNWLGRTVRDMLGWLGNALLLPINQAVGHLDDIRNNTDNTTWFEDATSWLTGLFVPSDLDIKFTALMDFFNTKFGLLLYPFELIIDIVDRFMLVQGIDRISFYGFAEQTSGVTILPAFYIDIGDLRSQYEFLDYIFATIKMLVTTFFIFNFIRFLYYYYEDVRDS